MKNRFHRQDYFIFNCIINNIAERNDSSETVLYILAKDRNEYIQEEKLLKRNLPEKEVKILVRKYIKENYDI